MKVHINILEMKVGKVVWVPACKFLKKNLGGGGGGGNNLWESKIREYAKHLKQLQYSYQTLVLVLPNIGPCVTKPWSLCYQTLVLVLPNIGPCVTKHWSLCYQTLVHVGTKCDLLCHPPPPSPFFSSPLTLPFLLSSLFVLKCCHFRFDGGPGKAVFNHISTVHTLMLLWLDWRKGE